MSLPGLSSANYPATPARSRISIKSYKEKDRKRRNVDINEMKRAKSECHHSASIILSAEDKSGVETIDEVLAQEQLFPDRSLFASSDEECERTQEGTHPHRFRKQEKGGNCTVGKKEAINDENVEARGERSERDNAEWRRNREDRRVRRQRTIRNRSDIENEANQVVGVDGDTRKRSNESPAEAASSSKRVKGGNKDVQPGWEVSWKERGYPYFGNHITPGNNKGKEVGMTTPRMDGEIV